MIRTIGRFALQLVGVALITCALSEFALRVFDYFRPMFIFYDPTYNRFRLRPFSTDWGDFKLNSGGFKDLEFGPKSPGVYRILGLGDSFAFGVVPYRHNYLTLLEEGLKQRNPAVEVLNLGIPGIGPREYLALLVREGLSLQPDAVLLSFFVGNDFAESGREKRPLYSYSHVASLIRYLFSVLPSSEVAYKRRRAEYSDYCDDCPNIADQTYLEIVERRSRIYLEPNQRFPVLLDDAAYFLGEIQKLCARRGIEFLVAIIPDEVQVDLELQRRVREKFFPGRTWNNTRPNAELAARLKELGIESLDLYPDFAAEAAHRILYRPRDTHWNIPGNRLAADVMLRELPARIGQQPRPD